MKRETSIFYKMTAENENSATDLLCNLFRIKYFRDICLEYFGINKEILEEISLESLLSQNTTNDSGILDIVIETNNLIYIIENKIQKNADLQENQKINYPKFLLKFQKKQIGYIFLIPKNYEHEHEIDIIIKKYNFTRKYYWQDFLSFLYKKELHIESSIIKEGLLYFSKLVHMDEPENTILNTREVVIMYNPKTIYDVLQMVDKIRETVNTSLKLVVKRMGKDYSLGSEQKNQWGHGFGLNYKNRGSIFVGISPGVYEKENGIFVFSLAIVEKHLKENYKIDQFKFYSDGEWIYIAIDRSLFAEEDNDIKNENLSNEVIKILKNVFENNYL